MLEGNQGRVSGVNYTGLSYKDIHEDLFLPFAQKVANLVNAEKGISAPNAIPRAEMVNTADQYCATLTTVCQWWTELRQFTRNGKEYSYSLWHTHDNTLQWSTATAFLGDPTFDARNQLWIDTSNGPPDPSPIDVSRLLAEYGSGQRPPGGPPKNGQPPATPPGKLASLGPQPPQGSGGGGGP